MRRFLIPTTVMLAVPALWASASADTLDLMRTSIATGIPMQAEEEDSSVGLYIRHRLGVNFMEDANTTDLPSSGTLRVAPGGTSRAGLQGVHFSFDAGVDSTIAFGYEVSPGFSIEAAVGIAWNPVSQVSGIINVPTGDPINPNATSSLGGGSGDLFQVPVFVNFNADIPLSTEQTEFWPFIGRTATLTVHAGVGMTYSRMKFENGVLSAVDDVPQTLLSLDHGAFAFGYEIGTHLRVNIADNLELGGYFTFRGTARTNLGTAEFSNAGLYTAGDLSASALLNYAAGVTLRYEF